MCGIQLPKPKKQANKKNSTKTKQRKNPNKPQMCYLLIICDFQTLFPWGTQCTDFLLTKGDFTGEQIHSSSPKPGSHTGEFLYCVCKAHSQKPQGGNGPVPSTCSEGGASCFESLFWLCFPREDPPGGCIRFSHGVKRPPCSPAAIYTSNNLPRQTLALQPFPHPLP